MSASAPTAYTLTGTTTLPFADAVALARETLAEEGFGVLAEIDVQATLRAKLGGDRALPDPRSVQPALRPSGSRCRLRARGLASLQRRGLRAGGRDARVRGRSGRDALDRRQSGARADRRGDPGEDRASRRQGLGRLSSLVPAPRSTVEAGAAVGRRPPRVVILPPMGSRRSIGVTLFLCLAASQASLLVLTPVLAAVASGLDVSTATAGQLRTVSGLAAGVTALLTGLVATRVGLRELLGGSLALIALGSTASALAPDFCGARARPARDRRRYRLLLLRSARRGRGLDDARGALAGARRGAPRPAGGVGRSGCRSPASSAA